MLQLYYFKDSVRDLVTDVNKQVVTGAGYNAIVELLLTRQKDFPCIVLEDPDGGELSSRPGGFDNYTQSIWVMDRVGANQNPEPFFTSTKTLLKKVVARLIRLNSGEEFPKIKNLDLSHIPYMKREGGNELAGWEAVITIREDVDLSDEQPRPKTT